MKIKVFNPHAANGYVEYQVIDFNHLYHKMHVMANIERVKKLTGDGCQLNVQPLFRQAFAADKYNNTRLATDKKYPANVYVYDSENKFINNVSCIQVGIYMFPNEIIDLLSFCGMCNTIINGLRALPEFEKVYVFGEPNKCSLFHPNYIDQGNNDTKLGVKALSPRIGDAFNALFNAYRCGYSIPDSLKRFKIENMNDIGLEFNGRIDWSHGLDDTPSKEHRCITNYVIVENDDLPVVSMYELRAILSSSPKYAISRGRLDAEGMQTLIQSLSDSNNGSNARQVMFNCILEFDWDDTETALRACYAMYKADYGRWFGNELKSKSHLSFCKELIERGVPDMCNDYTSQSQIIKILKRKFGYIPDDIFDDLKKYFKTAIKQCIRELVGWEFDEKHDAEMIEVMCNELKEYYNEEKERKNEEHQC